ncbi:MAG: hypothetical protein RLZZ29_1508, partial [Cyanobacteriota bacterium]
LKPILEKVDIYAWNFTLGQFFAKINR